MSDKLRFGFGAISGYKLEGRLVREGDHDSVIPFIAAEYDITKDVSIAWFGEVINLELKF